MSKSTKAREIVTNKKARHDYHLYEKIEAGLVLEGWEVKSLRAFRGQLQEGYILIKNNECWLIGCHISPLPNTAGFKKPDPTRTRKCLLTRKEINKLIGAQKQQGYTIVPLRIILQKNLMKIEISLAKGKKNYDKRESEKQKEWKREQEKIIKKKNHDA